MINVKAFWDFVIEREYIRLRRLNGLPRKEWTYDPIMMEYSFTNVKRMHDRTTALLFREFYDHAFPEHPYKVGLLNAALFRYHGTIESARAIGWHSDWNPQTKAALIDKNELRMALGETVFTSAYIVPNCGDTRAKHEIVADIISGIWMASTDALDTQSWEEACKRLCQLWGVGSFMAKEVLLDYVLITGWEPDDWHTWTPVGPGGCRGAGFVKYDMLSKIPEWEALEVIRDLYAGREEYWPSDMVDLELTDIQFQLCEVAKYMKVKRGEGRPKRKFWPTVDDLTQKCICKRSQDGTGIYPNGACAVHGPSHGGGMAGHDDD